MIETKYCHGCETTKKVAEFSKSKATKDGLQVRCKECNKKYKKKKYLKKNKDFAHTKWKTEKLSRETLLSQIQDLKADTNIKRLGFNYDFLHKNEKFSE